MMTLTLLAGALVAAQAAPQTQVTAEPQQPPADETRQASTPASEALESKKLDKDDPEYVRCKTETVIGSRAKRKRTCMTNREWALVERRGNEQSKEFAGDNFAAGHY